MSAFHDACRDIAELEHGRPLNRDDAARLQQAYTVVTRQLPMLVRKSTQVQSADADEIAQDALLKFVQATRAGRVRPDASPGGYLLRTAIRVESDRRRRTWRVEFTDLPLLPPTSAEEQDAISRLLDHLTSQGDVMAGLGLARERQDETVLRTIASWLDLAHALGRAPTTREVGQADGVSHTIVSRRLRKFRDYLEQGRDNSVDS